MSAEEAELGLPESGEEAKRRSSSPSKSRRASGSGSGGENARLSVSPGKETLRPASEGEEEEWEEGEEGEEEDEWPEDEEDGEQSEGSEDERRTRKERPEETDDDDESEDKLSEEEAPPDPYAYRPSEADFQESDLLSRKKRRYLIGKQSFLELVDPELENALVPAEQDAEHLRMPEEKSRHKGLNAERDKYRELCEKGGFKPNPNFLRALGTNILDLTNHGLNENEIEAICTALCDDKHIEICRLSGNACGKKGGLAIAEMIRDNYTIEELALSNSEILDALEEICEALSQTTSLISLDLSKNELVDQDMVPIANAIAECQSIKTLCLRSNEIKDQGLSEIGSGLFENTSMVELDLSGNKIRGEGGSARFFNACMKHPSIRILNFHHNLIGDEGAAGFQRVLWKNDRLMHIDLTENLLRDGAGPSFGRGLGTGKPRELEELIFGHQRWHQDSASALLGPLGNRKNVMPIQLVDFGWMLDIHKTFITARDRAKQAHPELKILHGEPYGLQKAKNPDEKPLVIRRANIVCENFETPLSMLMEELAKEPPTLDKKAFKKFIKQCNLYKDKTLTEAFENVFATEKGDVDGEAIVAAFDKEYPGVRKIPEPPPEGEEVPVEEPKEKKGKKDKKKGGRKSRKSLGGKGKRKSQAGKSPRKSTAGAKNKKKK